MLTLRAAIIVVVLALGCGKGADDKPKPTASDARPVAATDYLALTEQPVAELPETAYQPGHSDAEYVAIEGTAIPLRFYIEPLNEDLLEARGKQMQADFQQTLGRTVSDDEARRWKREMIEDIGRRRLAARALLDLHLAGELSLEELDARFGAIHEGIDLAFRRITRITVEEHAKLAGG